MESTPQSRAERLIAALENIKAILERKYNTRFSGAGEACRQAAKRGHPVVKRNQADLELATELRNVIQHNPNRAGVPIADPREGLLDVIEEIARRIENPPPIHKYASKPQILGPDDSLKRAAEQIVQFDLSQVPVYEGSTYVGLLTTNALARWLSSSIEEHADELVTDEANVRAVLEHAEAGEKATFVKPNSSALSVCDKLSNVPAPPAVLVTSDGTAKGSLQGIVTRFDVPNIQKQLDIREQ